MTVRNDTAAQSQSKKSRATWLLMLVLVCAVAGGAWWYLKGRKQTVAIRPGIDGLASVAPADTQIFVAIDMREKVDVGSLVSRLAELKRQYPEIGRQVDDVEKKAGLEFKDLAKWLQPAGYIAVLPREGQKSLLPGDGAGKGRPIDVVAASPVSDEEAAMKTLDILKRKARREVREGKQEGVTLWLTGTGDDEVAFGVAHKHFWFGSGATAVGRALRAATASATSLADKPSFVDARKRTPSRNGLFAFVDLQAVLAPLGDTPALKPYLDDQTLQGAKSLQYAAMSYDVARGSPDAQVFMKVDSQSQSPFIKAMLTANSISPSLSRFFPAGWGSYLSVNLVYLGTFLYQASQLFPVARYQIGNLPTLAGTALGFNPFTEFLAVSNGDLAISSDARMQLPALVGGNLSRARDAGQLTACKVNLKTIGTAVEMFSTDHGGHYPASLSELTPNYLRRIPTCPSAGSDTYSASWRTSADPNRYEVACGGTHHGKAGLSENSPAYDSQVGLKRYAAAAPPPKTVPQLTYLAVLSLKNANAAIALINKLEEKAHIASRVVNNIAGAEIHGYDRLAVQWTVVEHPQTVLVCAQGPQAEKRLEEALRSPSRAADSVEVQADLLALLKETEGKVVEADFTDLTPMVSWAVELLDQSPINEAPPQAAPLIGWLRERLKGIGQITAASVVSVESDGLRLHSRGLSILATSTVAIAAAIIVPNFIRARYLQEHRDRARNARHR